MIEATPDHSVGHRFLRAIVLESDIEVIADRLRVRYRVRNHEPDGWFLVEQQAYLTTGPSGIEACNLICSGFRPIAAPNTKRSPGPA